MSSLRRTINQSMREGTSTRRHALSGPTTKSMKNVAHTNAVPASPMRYRTKYELRSISLEGNKVLPWTTRTTHSRDQSVVYKVLVIKETGLEAIPLLILIQEELYQQQQRDIRVAHRYAMPGTSNGDIRHGAAIRHSDSVRVRTYMEEQIDK
ncbi:hypothetical protein ALC60_03475 [Trachymyrmex zeteki]|uniref:Uncharacterized protein n=1 Tax=Mycetomoellerius zeteki TaxID=64791 RepID=A0A151XAV4_9HYME|nr:hypothetical protein ALC60_03475 [Trachymyrmex zeteki]